MQLRGIKSLLLGISKNLMLFWRMRIGSSAPYKVAPTRDTSSSEDLPIAQGKKSQAKHPSLGYNEENDPDLDENNSEDQHLVEQFHEDRFSRELQALSKIYLSQGLRGVTTL
ncbi:hypothetical protein ACFE04_011291 [Oxalis oulophora]